MSSQTIPCVTLGKYRHIAEAIANKADRHDYSVNAILDETNYSDENLGVVLRILRPRPKALLIGGGYTDEEADGAITVWKKYVKDIEVTDTTIVRVPVGTLEKLGPEGILSWVIEELDKTYKK